MIRHAWRTSLALCTVIGPAIAASGPKPAHDVDLAAVALIMGGTNQVLSVGPMDPQSLGTYVEEAHQWYIAPTGLCTGGSPGCILTAVYTPAELGPFTGAGDLPLDASIAAGLVNLDTCLRGGPCTATAAPYTSTAVQSVSDSVFVVRGISQSAIIASHEKAALIEHPVRAITSFVLVSNQGRPNGGLLERFAGFYIPYLGIAFTGATPTNSPREAPLLTVDYARQYDAWVDFPNNPLNLLSTVNALLGALYLHPRDLFEDGPPLLQGYYQDTTYYLGRTDLLPLVIPIAAIPVIGLPLARALDPPLRVLVEAGYDRTINPGRPTPADYLYFPDPVKTVFDFLVAIPTGWDDAISQITSDPDNRPFGTAPQPVYGVGGPPVYAGAVDPYVQPAVEPGIDATRQPHRKSPQHQGL